MHSPSQVCVSEWVEWKLKTTTTTTQMAFPSAKTSEKLSNMHGNRARYWTRKWKFFNKFQIQWTFSRFYFHWNIPKTNIYPLHHRTNTWLHHFFNARRTIFTLILTWCAQFSILIILQRQCQVLKLDGKTFLTTVNSEWLG